MYMYNILFITILPLQSDTRLIYTQYSNNDYYKLIVYRYVNKCNINL